MGVTTDDGIDAGVEVAPGPPGPEAVGAWRQPEDVRVRTVRWDDPRALAAAAMDMSGLQLMRAISDGQLAPPPLATLLGFAPTEIEEGRVVFAIEPGEHLYNPLGTVHGGVISALLDSAMGCAVQTTLPPRTAYTTTDLQVRFVRPVTTETGRVEAEGTLVHRGSRLATAEGRLIDVRGRLLAHATTSCLLWEVASSP